ncbi:MAG TPA: hypothetical protein DEB06_02375, partial [Phycisphaerales bacterium]|nr:hypothetical protein [Phycisphaerales bacterium]
ARGDRGARAGRDDSTPQIEWRARELSERFEMVVTGVGKANAAGAVARVLDAGRHAGVINLGVAGALPGAL